MVDFAFMDAATTRYVKQSTVLDLHSRLKHRYLLHVLKNRDINIFVPLFRWNPRTLDVDQLKRKYDVQVVNIILSEVGGADTNERYMNGIERACDCVMGPVKISKRQILTEEYWSKISRRSGKPESGTIRRLVWSSQRPLERPSRKCETISAVV